MLWIETHDGMLVNMAHVVAIYIRQDGNGHWLTASVGHDHCKIARGETEKQCKVMRYRIQTYLGLDKDYSDRNIIQHKWLTHKLP